MESIAELRERVQAPVRKYNDVAGVLVGDRVSIHVTRFFLQLGLSPTVATLGMLVFGLAGSALLPFGGAWSSVGFALVFVYYILDCVDGEVARYHQREKLIFGFHDFLFHLYVKSAFFVCLGLHAVRVTGESSVFFFPLAALLAVLYQKFLNDLPLILTSRYILLRKDHERDHFVEQVLHGAAPGELAQDGALPEDHRPVAYTRPLGLLRAALTNFDLAVLLFLGASIADLVLGPFTVVAWPANCVVALAVFYGIVLPLDFLDHLRSHIRNRRFVLEARRLLRGAHQFHVDD